MFPYLFVLSPHMLMLDATPLEVLYSALSPTMGVIMVGIAVEGHLFKTLPNWMRALVLAGSLSLLHPGLLTDMIGLGILIFVIVTQKIQMAADGQKPAAA